MLAEKERIGKFVEVKTALCYESDLVPHHSGFMLINTFGIR